MLNFGGVAQEKDSDWLGMRKDNISVTHQTSVSGFTSSTVIRLPDLSNNLLSETFGVLFFPFNKLFLVEAVYKLMW